MCAELLPNGEYTITNSHWASGAGPWLRAWSQLPAEDSWLVGGQWQLVLRGGGVEVVRGKNM